MVKDQTDGEEDDEELEAVVRIANDSDDEDEVEEEMPNDDDEVCLFGIWVSAYMRTTRKSCCVYVCAFFSSSV